MFYNRVMCNASRRYTFIPSLQHKLHNNHLSRPHRCANNIFLLWSYSAIKVCFNISFKTICTKEQVPYTPYKNACFEEFGMSRFGMSRFGMSGCLAITVWYLLKSLGSPTFTALSTLTWNVPLLIYPTKSHVKLLLVSVLHNWWC